MEMISFLFGRQVDIEYKVQSTEFAVQQLRSTASTYSTVVHTYIHICTVCSSPYVGLVTHYLLYGVLYIWTHRAMAIAVVPTEEAVWKESGQL